MRLLAAGGLTPRTLLEVVVGALVAGLGVTAAFSVLIYCSDRALQLRRSARRHEASAFTAAAVLALLACLALVAFGLVLVVSKTK